MSVFHDNEEGDDLNRVLWNAELFQMQIPTDDEFVSFDFQKKCRSVIQKLNFIWIV